MGASYQLIPIALEREIWSERLARWQLAIIAVAVTGMVAHFQLGTWPGLAPPRVCWPSASRSTCSMSG